MVTLWVRGWRKLFNCGICLTLAGGCATGTVPRPVYQDIITSIRLSIDERTDEKHSHPAPVTVDVMTSVLQGLHVVSRQGVLTSIVLGRDQGRQAFSPVEVAVLAPQLVRALEVARPNELITFYRRFSDAGVGLAITSGGLFVHKTHLYFIMANNRTLPSAGMNQNIVTEIDPLDSPLLPISRTDFRLLFEPAVAVVPSDERLPWPYTDEGRLVAVDLVQLARVSHAQSSPSPAP